MAPPKNKKLSPIEKEDHEEVNKPALVTFMKPKEVDNKLDEMIP